AELSGHLVGRCGGAGRGPPRHRKGHQDSHGARGKGAVKAWTEWEVSRRQVAIGGRVLDDDGRPASEGVPGTAVATERRQERAKRRRVGRLGKVDAIYYFLDLSPGSYIVRAIHERTEAVGERTVSVSSSEEGRVRMAVADLKLSKAARGG